MSAAATGAPGSTRRNEPLRPIGSGTSERAESISSDQSSHQELRNIDAFACFSSDRNSISWVSGPYTFADVTEATDGPLSRALLRLMPNLNERQRRLALGAVAEGLGRGGVRTVARAARVAESTVSRGVRELDGPHLPTGRVRRAGAGRRPLTERDPGLLPALLGVARSTGPEGTVRSPLEWTTLSVRELAQALTLLGHPVGPDTVSSLLKAEGFTLQPSAYTSVRGTREHRIARLRHGAALLRGFTDAGHPVIRVRTEPAAEPGRRARTCGECVQEQALPQDRATGPCAHRGPAGPRPAPAGRRSRSTTPGPPRSSPTPSATGGRRRAARCARAPSGCWWPSRRARGPPVPTPCGGPWRSSPPPPAPRSPPATCRRPPCAGGPPSTASPARSPPVGTVCRPPVSTS